MGGQGKNREDKKTPVKDKMNQLMVKGRHYNKESMNQLIATKFKGISPRKVDAILRDLIAENKLTVETVDGKRIFSLI